MWLHAPPCPWRVGSLGSHCASAHGRTPEDAAGNHRRQRLGHLVRRVARVLQVGQRDIAGRSVLPGLVHVLAPGLVSRRELRLVGPLARLETRGLAQRIGRRSDGARASGQGDRQVCQTRDHAGQPLDAGLYGLAEVGEGAAGRRRLCSRGVELVKEIPAVLALRARSGGVELIEEVASHAPVSTPIDLLANLTGGHCIAK